MRRSTAAKLFGTVGAIAFLAGCASKPHVSAQTESNRYLSNAGRSYTPPGPSSDPWGPYIREASQKYDVPEKWIREVMRQESGGHLYGRGGQLITSGAGAMGLMQVMPATYDDLRSRYRELGDDPYDPHNNILAGAAYVREMYDIYGAPGFLAAYNAGPGRLDDYLTRNRTLPLETRRYVAAIGPRIAGHEPSRPSPGAMYAMNAISLDIPAGPRYPEANTQFASAAPLPSKPIVLNPPEPSYAQPAYAAPVEVAQASGPFIKLSPQPEPVEVAEAPPVRSFIQLDRQLPQPVVVAQASEPRFEPAPRYSPAPPPAQPREAPTRFAAMPIPEPPAPPPSLHGTRFARTNLPAGRPIEVAEMPEPPRMPARFAAAAELVPVLPHHHSFSLIPTATAAPFHSAGPIASGGGAWAVQVGAFSNQNQAHSATLAARQNAQESLRGAHTVVAGVHQSGGTLYRARLGGLSHEAAAQACERLSRARTNCMV
ncbi:MAG: transglycosylase SLT domain-containing protein, partial [Acetobacteraceae bacterium]|nr:transglycosylase SLT domain-containing protein [Acetobacteraceae bacterium]